MVVMVVLVAGCGGAVIPAGRSYVPSRLDGAPTSDVVSAEFAEVAPIIDGVVTDLEDVWSDATEVILTAKDETTEVPVSMKAAYDDHNVYLLFTWADDKAHIGGKMWEMRERDGQKSWKFGSQLGKEDMISIAFESTKIEGFETEGCNVLCHSGPNYMLAPNMGEFLDVWTWRAASTFFTAAATNHVVGPLGPSFDQDAEDFNTKSAIINMPGSLIQNMINVASPAYVMSRGLAPTQIGDFTLMEPVPEDINSLPLSKAPYFMKLPGKPDIVCMASYNDEDEENKFWTVEMRRPLTTDNPLQVQFAHNPAEDGYYLFHLSIFDNQMGEGHIYTEAPATLEFVGK